MKKIVILANNDIGLYKFRKELIIELLKENKVYISLPHGGYINELVEIGCKFIDTKIDRRGINPIQDFKLIFNYLRLIISINPDLIITYTIKPNIYGGLVSRLCGKRYVTNITGLGTAFQKKNALNAFIILLYKISLKKASRVFFENYGNFNVFFENKIVLNERAKVLNGAGVNLNEYFFANYPEEHQVIRFLFIGRLMKEKGLDEFIQVAKLVKSKNEFIEFDIVGPDEEGYSGELYNLTSKGILNYYGYQKEVRDFIIKAHCVVLPSYHEGMSNTLLESASMGRPIITSNIYGCRELVNGKNGFLCEPQDVNSLYRCVHQFIYLPHCIKSSMGNESRKHISESFDRIKIIERTIESLEL